MLQLYWRAPILFTNERRGDHKMTQEWRLNPTIQTNTTIKPTNPHFYFLTMRQTRSATKRAESAKEQDSAAAPSSKTAFPSDKGNGKKMPSKKAVEGKTAKKKKTMTTKSPASTKKQVTINLEDASSWKECAKQRQLIVGDHLRKERYASLWRFNYR